MRTGTATAIIVTLFALAFAGGYGNVEAPLAGAGPAARSAPVRSDIFTSAGPRLILRLPN